MPEPEKPSRRKHRRDGWTGNSSTHGRSALHGRGIRTTDARRVAQGSPVPAVALPGLPGGVAAGDVHGSASASWEPPVPTDESPGTGAAAPAPITKGRASAAHTVTEVSECALVSESEVTANPGVSLEKRPGDASLAEQVAAHTSDDYGEIYNDRVDTPIADVSAAAVSAAEAVGLGAAAAALGEALSALEAEEVANAHARAAIREALLLLEPSAPAVKVTTAAWEPDWADINAQRDAVVGLGSPTAASSSSANPALTPLAPAHQTLYYSSTEAPLDEERFKACSDRLAESPTAASELLRKRMAQARDVLRRGRRARAGGAAKPTRLLAVFLARSLLAAALQDDGARDPVHFAQFIHSSDATSSESARVAAAIAAITTGDPAAPFRARMGEAQLLQPQSLVSVVKHAYLRELAQATAQEAAAGKPHAMDAQAMYLASPLAPDGKSDEASKRRLRAEATRIRQIVEAQPTQGSSVVPPPGGSFDGVAMARRHLAQRDACPHCMVGDCRIFEVAALASLGPVVCYPGQRPAAPKGSDPPPEIHTYVMEPEEEEKQEAEIAKLVGTGAIEPCTTPTLVMPTFFAYRHRYAESEAAAAVWWAPDASAEALQQHLDEEINAILSCASEVAPGEVAMGPVPSARVQKALAMRSLTDAGRLVYDYGVLNDAGCSWPMAMCTASEMLTYVQPGSWIASVDVKAGFHHVPVHEADRPMMAFACNSTGALYQPTRLMFGLRQAPAHFSTATAEVVQTAQREIWAALGPDCGVKLAVYIDDIFVFAPSEDLGKRGLAILSDYCVAVGVKLKDEKQRDPSQDAPLLGLRVNTERMEVYIPADKRYNMLFLTHLALACADRGQPVPVSIMRKLTGKLVHFLSVFPEGLVHMAPLWDVCEARQHGSCDVRSSPAAVQSLHFFHCALASGEAGASKCVPAPTSPTAAPWVRSFSDASGDVGFGINMGPVVIHGTWRDGIADPRGEGNQAAGSGRGASIGMKELYPLVLLAYVAGDMLTPFTWSPKTDNLPNVFSMLKGHTDDRDAKPWLTVLLALQSAREYMVIPGWCPRQLNQFMDEVSKAEDVPGAEQVIARFQAEAERLRQAQNRGDRE